MTKVLTLVIIQPNAPSNGKEIQGFTQMRLDTNLISLEEELKAVGQPLDSNFLFHHDEYGLVSCDRDKYAQPFVTVTPRQMVLALFKNPLLSEWDDSVMKFIDTLDPNTKIIPWWN